MPKRQEKKVLGQRHLHLPAVGQGREQPLCLGIVSVAVSVSENAQEVRLLRAPPVGCQQSCIADVEAHVHHFVQGAGRKGKLASGAFLEAHELCHLGAGYLSVYSTASSQRPSLRRTGRVELAFVSPFQGLDETRLTTVRFAAFARSLSLRAQAPLLRP